MKPSFSRRMAYSQMTNVMNKEEAKQPKKFELVDQEPVKSTDESKDIRNEFISKPLPLLFQEQADRTPEAIAINIDRKTMSYADLRHHMIEVAWRLKADLGISKGDVVGI